MVSTDDNDGIDDAGDSSIFPSWDPFAWGQTTDDDDMSVRTGATNDVGVEVMENESVQEKKSMYSFLEYKSYLLSGKGSKS